MTIQAKRIEFASREAWLKHRKTGLGGSDIIDALGYGRYKSPYTLWAEKRGDIEPLPVDSVAAWLGHVMEPPMAEWFQQETGRQVENPGEYTIYEHPEKPYLFVTPDRMFDHTDCRELRSPLSIKTTSDPELIEIWKSGEATAAAGAQLNMEMEILGKEHGAFAVLTFGWQKERLWFDVERSDSMIKDIIRELDEFWQRVQSGDPPPIDGSESTRWTIYRMHEDDSGAVVELPAEVLGMADDIELSTATIKRLQEGIDLAENKIRAWIGDATYGQFGDVIYANATTQRKDTIKVDIDQREYLEEFGIPFEDKPGSKFRTLRQRKSIG